MILDGTDFLSILQSVDLPNSLILLCFRRMVQEAAARAIVSLSEKG